MQNKVEILGHYGGDLTHSLSAWTSTTRDLTDDKVKRIPKLLKMLADDKHGTPFEKSAIHFLITVEQPSHIHLLKHRIGVSINGECLTGDSVITFNNTYGTSNKKLKKTVKQLFDSWNQGRKHQNTEADKYYNRKRIKNMNLRVLDESTNLFKTSHIKDIWYKGVQPVYEIVLKNGNRIKCTNNHSIWTGQGYKTISDGLCVGSLVGCNGISIEVDNKPWTFPSFYENAFKYTRKEFSKYKNLKYELIKKWGYIFNVEFKKDENKDFKKGNKPWNSGKSGYKIDVKNRKYNPLKGESSHFWRGGITEERALIGSWTTSNSFKVHKKYNFTCQNCGNSSCTLHAHHIIPVSIDITKAYDFDNLITVCKECHHEIHKTVESERDFAKKVLSPDFEIKYKEWGNNKKRPSRKLAVHYSPIISINYIGEKDTYDIEVDGSNNNFVANNIVVHNSARYKELKEDKFYLPEDWNGIEFDDSKFNKFTKEFTSGYETWKQLLERYSELGNELYHTSLEQITPILGKKRAKESARFFKTMNSQIDLDIMFNFRSFIHFYFLRSHDTAQKEIQNIAKEMLKQIKEIEGNPFKESLNAFGL